MYHQSNLLIQSSLCYVCTFLFSFSFLVAAGLFLLNRRHRQAMGLHRRHTHQGTAPPSWLVRYLSVQPAPLGPFSGVVQCAILLFSFRPTSSDSLFTAFTRQSTTWASFSSSFPLQGTKDQVGVFEYLSSSVYKK